MKQLCSTDVVPIVQFVAMTRMHICIVVRVIWLIVMWNVTQLLQTVSLSLQFLPLMIKMSTTDEKKEKSSLFWLRFLWLVQFREHH